MRTTAEDRDKIRSLQVHLQQVLDRWDATDPQVRDFGGLVPIVNELGDALRELLRGRAEARTVRTRRFAGWLAVVAGVLCLVSGFFGEWHSVPLVIGLLAAASGAVLLVTGGARD